MFATCLFVCFVGRVCVCSCLCVYVQAHLVTSSGILCLSCSSFKHLIGGLEDVSSKGHEDADAKAK